MKILLASHGFPPRQAAGAEWRTSRTAHALAAAGVKVQVLAVDATDESAPAQAQFEHERLGGFDLYRLSCRLNQTPGQTEEFNSAALGQALLGFLQQQRPDVLHIISGYRLTGSAIMAARAAGVPVVITLTDFWFLCPRITLQRSSGELCSVPDDPLDCALCLLGEKRRYSLPHALTGGLSGQLLKVAWRATGFAGAAQAQQLEASIVDRRRFLLGSLAHANRLIAPSQFLGDMFLRQGIAPEQLRIIRQGVGIPPRQTTGGLAPGAPLRLGYVGQFAEHKGVHVLVGAVQRLPHSAQQLQLSIYGRPESGWPPYVRQLKKLIGADARITLAGGFNQSEAAEIYRQFDALVMPSLWYENSPNVILEAFASGVPVIASRLGGMAEIIGHESNGLLFETGDAQLLADAIQRLIAEPQLLARLRAGIPPMATVEQEMATLTALYAEVVAEGPGHAAS